MVLQSVTPGCGAVGDIGLTLLRQAQTSGAVRTDVSFNDLIYVITAVSLAVEQEGASPQRVRSLRPQAWVIPSWHISHPDMLQLKRMLSQRLYPGPREVYATSLMAAKRLANRRLTSQLRSRDGHVVVRVAPDGAS
ncbi:hypothetical protein GTP46_02290 [Duganella sp. FT135W]|uniref:Transcriptional regulator SbtR-like C-terminal domain-containing protein n=2 Tax=Duganella flavida TaxID=2692175 RepID=A0A6L8K3J3_9BURK|nr:hypothetical protein [Duganella flavida]MYM21475.1 hypothetical protein [Duganella flavida]